MKWNTTSSIWPWITVPPALLAVILCMSLLGVDGRLTVFVVLTCMLGISPVLLFHIYRRDMQSRDQSERALRESEERYRQLVELSPNGIVVHRLGKILYFNEAFARLVGAPSAGDHEEEASRRRDPVSPRPSIFLTICLYRIPPICWHESSRIRNPRAGISYLW